MIFVLPRSEYEQDEYRSLIGDSGWTRTYNLLVNERKCRGISPHIIIVIYGAFFDTVFTPV